MDDARGAWRYWRLLVVMGLLMMPLLSRAAPPVESEQPSVEYGQVIEGAGSANFSWLRYEGMKFGVAFRAPRTGKVVEITLPWKTGPGYGEGKSGVYDFDLCANAADNFPSATVLGRAKRITPKSAMDGYADGPLHFKISASLEEGTIYHLVVTNVDKAPRKNWSSPNTLMTRVQPWDGAGSRCAFYATDGIWRPWSSVNNPFNALKINDVNGSHCPLLLQWSDGTFTGDPYYSAAVADGAYFWGIRCAGQHFVWNGPTITPTRVGISVWKRGNPGPLVYHLEQVGAGEIASGTLDTAGAVGDMATWVYAPIAASLQLVEGQTYRLWFASPSGSDLDNCFYQCIPYGESRPAEWLETGWRGTAGYSIKGDGAAWTSYPHRDLTFSLQ